MWPSSPLTSYLAGGTPAIKAFDLNAFQSAINGIINATYSLLGVVIDGTGGNVVTPVAGAMQVTSSRSGATFPTTPTDNPTFQSFSGNPLSQRSPITVLSNPYVKARTSSASTWFIGDPRRAIALMENWPIQVIQAPANTEAEFNRDIVSQFKVTHKAVPAVLEPRRMVKSTA